MSGDSSSKSQKATPKRMKQLRHDGSLQRSQDLSAWVGMGAAALTHVMSGSRLYMLFINAYFLAAAIWVVRMERPRFLQVTESSERHT